MNQKQLANVLIKILCLWMCAEGVIRIISIIFNFLLIAGNQVAFFEWARNLLIGAIPLVIGIFFIVRSRWLVEKLFKDEAE